MSKHIILSPHFDDAVFSCWQIVSKPGSGVITIFTGIPAIGTRALWDRICGEKDSHQMMKKRSIENQESLQTTNTKIVNLGYLDHQYTKILPEVSEIADKIDSLTSPDDSFYAPLALGQYWRHPDHQIVRQVGQELARRNRKVFFYADVPYMRIPSRKRGKYQNDLQNRARRMLGRKVSLQISEISANQLQAKITAMECYRSQLTMTNLVSLGSLKRQSNIKHEIIIG